jgi:hypothetical protein
MTLDDWKPPASGKIRSPVPAACTTYVQPPPTQGFVLPLSLALLESRKTGSRAVAMYESLHAALSIRGRELSDPDVTG